MEAEGRRDEEEADEEVEGGEDMQTQGGGRRGQHGRRGAGRAR